MVPTDSEPEDTPDVVQNIGRLLLAELHLPAEERVRREAGRVGLVQYSGDLGGRFRWLRAERSLSQVEALTGKAISASRLQQLEAARLPNPSLTALLAMQRAYGCGSLEELLGPLPSGTWADLYITTRARHVQSA